MKQKIEYNSEELALAAVQGIREKKGLEIVTMDLRKVRGAITDFFVIASGTSDRHVQAVAESVEDYVRINQNDKPFNREGYQLGEWVLLDYSNVVVHVFQGEKRRFFDIESLWGDAEVKKHADRD
jgi:ribosome-associated protein